MSELSVSPLSGEESHVATISVAHAHGHSLQKRWQHVALNDNGAPRHHPTHEAGAWNTIDEAKAASDSQYKWTEIPNPPRFKAHSHSARSVNDFTELTTLNDLSNKPDRCIVQGVPNRASPDVIDTERDGTLVSRRTSKEYVDAPTRLMILDVDSWHFDGDPRDAAPEDIERAIDDAVAKLLPEFADCSYAVVLTGSAGFKEGLRARLFFWLDRLRTLAWQRACVDKANETAKSLKSPA